MRVDADAGRGAEFLMSASVSGGKHTFSHALHDGTSGMPCFMSVQSSPSSLPAWRK